MTLGHHDFVVGLPPWCNSKLDYNLCQLNSSSSKSSLEEPKIQSCARLGGTRALGFCGRFNTLVQCCTPQFVQNVQEISFPKLLLECYWSTLGCFFSQAKRNTIKLFLRQRKLAGLIFISAHNFLAVSLCLTCRLVERWWGQTQEINRRPIFARPGELPLFDLMPLNCCSWKKMMIFKKRTNNVSPLWAKLRSDKA